MNIIYPNCACNRNNYKEILSGVHNNREFQIIKCQKCGLSRTWPIFENENAIGKFYNEQEDYQERLNQLELWQSFGQRILKILKKYKNFGDLLDIGCNIGIFTDLARKNSYNAYGIDLSSKAIEMGKKEFHLENRLTIGKLEEINFPSNKFDIVTYLHVLEHIPDLNAELAKAYKVLKPRGIILIETPNFNSIWRKVLRARWYPLAPHQHIWQFEPQSLKKILENHKYSILETNTNYNMYHKISFDFKSLIKAILSFLSLLFRGGEDLIIVAQKNE